jgi:hypothetical protein
MRLPEQDYTDMMLITPSYSLVGIIDVYKVFSK